MVNSLGITLVFCPSYSFNGSLPKTLDIFGVRITNLEACRSENITMEHSTMTELNASCRNLAETRETLHHLVNRIVSAGPAPGLLDRSDVLRLGDR